MSRNYGRVRPKKHRVYSVEDFMHLYGISRNTLSNWVTSGLRPSDERTPQVFRGAELICFHKAWAVAKGPSRAMRAGEFKCVGCKAFVFPAIETVAVSQKCSGDRFAAMGTCPECGRTVTKLLSATVRNAIRHCVDTNTSLKSIDKGNDEPPAGIGKNQPNTNDQVSHLTRSKNDRTLLSWQGYAGKYDAKTVDAHLAAIRNFELFTNCKPFSKVTRADVVAWREAIIGTSKLSQSTVRHMASQVGAFFDWLSKQDGHKSLAALSCYFDLPKKFKQSRPPKVRDYPTMKEAGSLLAAMPSTTILELRQRAIFACAFICAFRADALISMRLKHVDVAGRKMYHDGAELRAKNGKSFLVYWFPKTGVFREVFFAWMDEIRALGLGPEDALFPEITYMNSDALGARGPGSNIEPMKSIGAVTDAFRVVSEFAGKRYSPHSARDTMIQLGDEICRTAEEQKAWSQNMGHSSERTTRRYYAKVDPAKQGEILEHFEQRSEVSQDDLDLLLDYNDRYVTPGTPEFERAEALLSERRSARAAAAAKSIGTVDDDSDCGK